MLGEAAGESKKGRIWQDRFLESRLRVLSERRLRVSDLRFEVLEGLEEGLERRHLRVEVSERRLRVLERQLNGPSSACRQGWARGRQRWCTIDDFWQWRWIAGKITCCSL